MSPTPDRTLDPQQLIAELQRQLAEAVAQLDEAQQRLIERTAERDEALDQQTATAEILGVINSSPGDLTPVFDVMLEKAMRLCDFDHANLWTYDGNDFHPVAMHGIPERFVEFLKENTPPGFVRLLSSDEPFIHFADVMATELGDTNFAHSVQELGQVRTLLLVPLRKDSAMLGIFTAYRREVRPFTDKQIALLQNFAAQAVIAMENARLITETREALEQQTATAEVLQVINSSPGDLGPVFDAILEKAHALCGAEIGSLTIYDGEENRAVATRGLAPSLAGRLRQGFRPGPAHPIRKLLSGARIVQVPDSGESADPIARASFELAGIRTSLYVPLRKDDRLLGLIVASRQEVRLFSDKEIALLENFAAQAVIAMENARLITETREALEQQTATADVLGVINSSPGDLAPVFEAMLETAARLCSADIGMISNREPDGFRVKATFSHTPEYEAVMKNRLLPANRGSVAGRAALERRPIQISDIASDQDYAITQSATLGNIRSALGVPLLREQVVVGVISLGRNRVQPFTDRQIELVRAFAAQAVIAMENARLITETREALEQQTATAEVLQVINSSPGDIIPVFDAMLEKAIRLCDGIQGTLWTFHGEHIELAASQGLSAELVEALRERRERHDPGEHDPVRRIMQGERLIQILDVAADLSHGPALAAGAEFGEVHTIVFVALVKDANPMGAFAISRREMRSFSDKQIALLQNFAAQAVIAMDNARLITETREALEQQTATAEVLQVINSSPGDLAPVFDAMLEKAMRLCDAAFGQLGTYDGERLRTATTRGVPAAFAEYTKSNPPNYGPGTAPARLLEGEHVVHVLDLADSDAYRSGEPNRRAIVDLAGARTLINVSLRKDDALLGCIMFYRQEVRPFSDKQIALLQNFAAQAVIAMENARLITETREALDQQTATAEVLQIINSSPGDLGPVFDAILEKAHSLCGAAFGGLLTYDGECLRAVAMHNVPAAFEKLARQPFRPGPQNRLSDLIRGERFIHIADLVEVAASAPDDAMMRAAIGLGGIRTLLAVPLRKDDTLLGVITAYRQEVRPFSEKEIALLQNFAAQAVIAMENARLLDQIRQRQAELRVTFDNMADGVAMFDEDLRLAAWNRNFQQIADIPEALLAERPAYADYLRILTERGELNIRSIDAELSRRLEDTDQELRLERIRPNGQVIEVRRNAVPDGGFVLIYSDITERKRSEQEIRAARDTAETTLRDLRAAQANLIQAEKMASLGQLTAGIAHEIKNPLNFVNNFAGLSVELLDELRESAAPGIATLGEDKRAEIDETMVMLTSNLEKIAEHGRRADGIVKSMLEHSRGVTSERRVVDLNNLIEEALNLAYHGARAQDQTFNIRLDRDFDRDLARIELVPQEMSRVFINLFGNGFYAATKRQRNSAETEFQPTLTVATRDLGEAVEVRVRDNGTGISADIKDKLFQPFFTTKPTGEGTGLGLSISYDIVTQQHGGTIEVDSRVGEFTEFTIRLPRDPQATRMDAAAWAQSAQTVPRGQA